MCLDPQSLVYRATPSRSYPITRPSGPSCSDGEAKEISVEGWEEVGKSVKRGWEALTVARVAYGNLDVEPLSQQWEELGGNGTG